MRPNDLQMPCAGTAVMSYYWLSYQYYDSPVIAAADASWKEKVARRDVRHGDKDGFTIALTGSTDSPELRAFCEANGVSVDSENSNIV